MEHIKEFETFNESANDPLIASIKTDMNDMKMDGQRHQGDLNATDKSVSVDFRDLGRWEHDEEAHSGDDEDDDDSWREDDDQMVWAHGEYKRYMAKFEEWAKNKPWYSKAKLSIEPSEKNWVSFVVIIK